MNLHLPKYNIVFMLAISFVGKRKSWIIKATLEQNQVLLDCLHMVSGT